LNFAAQPQWAGDSQQMYYLSDAMGVMALPILKSSKFDVGSPVELFRAPMPRTLVARRYFQPTRDGQRFLVHIRANDISTTPLVLTTNWTPGLNR
jgi:hypothetical protein